MDKKLKKGPLLQHLSALEERCKTTESMLIKDIFEVFGREGHYLFVLFLILPFLQPMPLFGLATPFGFLIAIVGLFAYLKKPAWIPNVIGNKKISRGTILKIISGAEIIFNKISFLVFPRMNFIFKEPFKTLNMILFVTNALLLTLPIPIPFSNAFPAWVILFQIIAHLEKDGLFMLLSYFQSLACAIYFSGVVWGLVLATLYYFK